MYYHYMDGKKVILSKEKTAGAGLVTRTKLLVCWRARGILHFHNLWTRVFASRSSSYVWRKFSMVNLTELTKAGGINTYLSNIKTVQKYKRWYSFCLIEGYFWPVCLLITWDLTEARDWSIWYTASLSLPSKSNFWRIVWNNVSSSICSLINHCKNK